MLKKKNVIRFILGLKIRQIRLRRDMSLKDLADRCDLSISYLNEIENGKKYPKIEKLAALAQGLDIDVGELVSFKTGRNLHPLLKFLESDMVDKVPLELFGLSESDVMALMGHDPEKFASFVLTILQVSRSFDIKMEDIYKAALRSYIEANSNYFADIEKMAKKFIETWDIKNDPQRLLQLKNIIEKNFHYSIDETEINQNPLFTDTKFLSKRDHKPIIYFNKNLTDYQKSYYLMKELGTLVPGTKKDIAKETLGELLENYKTSYFAGAVFLEEKSLSKELKSIFSQNKFNGELFASLLETYHVSPEVLFHRFTQILPSHFLVNELFFLAIKSDKNKDEDYVIENELHLSKLHSPHGVRMNENYCQRWVAIKSIKKLKENLSLIHPIIAQISIVEDQEYFSISIAYPSSINKNILRSLTIGFLVNEELKHVIKFLNDPHLKRIQIGQTCERCAKIDCLERMVEASIFNQEELEKAKLAAIAKLLQ